MKPGDVVIVIGIGGIGINAVQGARHAGATKIIAVDPVAMKRDAALKLGATDAFDNIEEAAQLARELTNGQGPTRRSSRWEPSRAKTSLTLFLGSERVARWPLPQRAVKIRHSSHFRYLR